MSNSNDGEIRNEKRQKEIETGGETRRKEAAEDRRKRQTVAEKTKEEKRKKIESYKKKRQKEAEISRENRKIKAENNKKKRSEEKKIKIEEENERLNLEAEKYNAKQPITEKAASKFGLSVFEAESVSSARLINAVSKEIYLIKARNSGNKVTFTVRSKDAAKVIAILDNLCYTYKIIKVNGFAPSLVRLSGRTGILLGLIAVAAAAVVYPHFITRVEVDGTLNAAARNILTESGVYNGNFLWDFDGNAVSDKLLTLNGIAFASVQKRGTSVYVTVKGERAPDIDDGTTLSGPVTAKKRASVTRVLVHGGTAEVKYGDIVEEGDVLIGEYVLVNEEKTPVNARGEVYGKIYHTMNVFFPDTELVKIIGGTKTFKRLSLFGRPKTPKSPYKIYSLEINETKSGFLIPYRAYTYVFTEIKTEKRANKRTDEAMAREALSRVFETLPADAKYMDGFYKIIRGDGGVKVEATIETEERIDI